MNAAEVLAKYRDEELPEFNGVDLQSVSTRGVFGNQPLHVACVRGLMDEVEALVSGGADVNSRGEHGNTPLHEAVGSSSAEILRYLLAHGADAKILNDFEQAAMDVAQLMGRESLTRIFSEHVARRVDH